MNRFLHPLCHPPAGRAAKGLWILLTGEQSIGEQGGIGGAFADEGKIHGCPAGGSARQVLVPDIRDRFRSEETLLQGSAAESDSDTTGLGSTIGDLYQQDVKGLSGSRGQSLDSTTDEAWEAGRDRGWMGGAERKDKGRSWWAGGRILRGGQDPGGGQMKRFRYAPEGVFGKRSAPLHSFRKLWRRDMGQQRDPLLRVTGTPAAEHGGSQPVDPFAGSVEGRGAAVAVFDTDGDNRRV